MKKPAKTSAAAAKSPAKSGISTRISVAAKFPVKSGLQSRAATPPTRPTSPAPSRNYRLALFLLRVALGWLFLYSGITKILNPEFTSAGFLGTAKTFPAFYQWFASADNIGWVDFLNIWGQTLIGLSLITGTLVRVSSFFGIILMALYYFPNLDFPYVEGGHGYLVDSHIIYIFIFAVLSTSKAGKYWGLDKYIKNS